MTFVGLAGLTQEKQFPDVDGSHRDILHPVEAHLLTEGYVS